MSDFGAGVGLNRDWDFEVDSTGDLTTVSGLDELEKDVAFNVARNWEDSIGRRVGSSTQKRIQITVRDVLIDEPRVNDIRNLTVRRVADNANKFEVVAEVNTIVGADTELVFEVPA